MICFPDIMKLNMNSGSGVTRPTQADFALVTINDSEDQAVRTVFGMAPDSRDRFAGARGVYGWCQLKGKTDVDQYIVVHASTADAKGLLPAIELIRELDRLFKPRYLLLLGTAGGIKERGIEYGRVIYSRQVHVGYQQLLDLRNENCDPCKVDIRLFDDPIQPPSGRLFLHAKSAAVSWVPSDEIKMMAEKSVKAIEECVSDDGEEATNWQQTIVERLNITSAQPPVATEIFSGSYLIDGRNSELFKSLKRTFPKVGAVEMEAGAIAQAVLHSVDTERFIGYLVIKGISDVVDSEVPADVRKLVRKGIAPFASTASTEFAKHIIETWSGKTDQQYGRISLVPPRYQVQLEDSLSGKRSSNSIVYENVKLDRYSQLLRDICNRQHGILSLWTFCYLAPYRFFAALDISTASESLDDDEHARARQILDGYKGRESELHGKLLETFPHFRLFAELGQGGTVMVTRIMHAGSGWDLKNEMFLPDFAKLNGNVDCFVLQDKDLLGEDWIHRDQVVINDELLFDYDQPTRRLVVTYMDPNGLGADFRRFMEHCQEKSRAARNLNERNRTARRGGTAKKKAAGI